MKWLTLNVGLNYQHVRSCFGYKRAEMFNSRKINFLLRHSTQSARRLFRFYWEPGHKMRRKYWNEEEFTQTFFAKTKSLKIVVIFNSLGLGKKWRHVVYMAEFSWSILSHKLSLLSSIYTPKLLTIEKSIQPSIMFCFSLKLEQSRLDMCFIHR